MSALFSLSLRVETHRDCEGSSTCFALLMFSLNPLIDLQTACTHFKKIYLKQSTHRLSLT